MSTPGFDYVRRLVRDRSGVVLDESKDYLITSRLEPLAKRGGFASLDDMLNRLAATLPGHLHTAVVEAMLTPETSFYRDLHPFEALRREVLPALIDARRAERTIRVWSAACATGQEPYSVAMLLREHFPQLSAWNVTLLASDLSAELLERARSGRFTQLEVNRGLPAALLVKYFDRRGPSWEINAAVRSMVEFRQINLATELPRDLPAFDLVFMRNVMIYFDDAGRRSALGRVRGLLRQDAYLFLGSTETTVYLDGTLVPTTIHGSVCYRPRSSGEGDERWNPSTRPSRTPSETSGR